MGGNNITKQAPVGYNINTQKKEKMVDNKSILDCLFVKKGKGPTPFIGAAAEDQGHKDTKKLGIQRTSHLSCRLLSPPTATTGQETGGMEEIPSFTIGVVKFQQ